MRMREMLSDFLVLAGGAVLVYGVSLISTVAAWIVGGIMLIVLGVALGLEGLHR